MGDGGAGVDDAQLATCQHNQHDAYQELFFPHDHPPSGASRIVRRSSKIRPR